MKKLQKRNLGVFGIFTFVLTMLFTMNVYAACSDVALNENEASLTHGGVKNYCSLKDALESVADGDTIKVEKDEVTISSANGNVSSKGSIASRKVGISFTFDLNGKKITGSEDDYAVFFIIGKSTITIKDSVGTGSIEHTGEGVALKVQDGTVTLESGTMKSDKKQAVEVAHPTNKGGKFILDGGTIEGDSGIFVAGEDFEVEVKSGKITTKSFAVSGNGAQTTNSKITISGGELTSTDNAAIYQPQSGDLTITGGTITGKIGIVARQGNVIIEGGIITGNGAKEDEISTGDAKEGGQLVKLQNGAAVIVDNKSSGYGGNMTVKITKGEFHAESDQAVVSYGNNESDFEVTGGSYDKPVDQKFVDDSKTTLSISTKDSNLKTWYIGQQAEDAVKEAAKNENSIIEVEQGSISIENAVSGVTVKNNGSGEVSVNDEKVNNGQDVIVTIQYKIQIGDKEFKVLEGTTFTDFFQNNDTASQALLELIEKRLEEAGIEGEEDVENKVADIYAVNLLNNKKIEENEEEITEDYHIDVVVVLKEAAEVEPTPQTSDPIFNYLFIGIISIGLLAFGSKKLLKRS